MFVEHYYLHSCSICDHITELLSFGIPKGLIYWSLMLLRLGNLSLVKVNGPTNVEQAGKSSYTIYTSVAYYTKEVHPSLVKPSSNFNGGLATFGLTSFVKWATGVILTCCKPFGSHWACVHNQIRPPDNRQIPRAAVWGPQPGSPLSIRIARKWPCCLRCEDDRNRILFGVDELYPSHIFYKTVIYH